MTSERMSEADADGPTERLGRDEEDARRNHQKERGRDQEPQKGESGNEEARRWKTVCGLDQSDR